MFIADNPMIAYGVENGKKHEEMITDDQSWMQTLYIYLFQML